MRTRLAALAAFAAAALSLAGPAAAPARAPLEIAVQDDGTFAGLPGIGPEAWRVRAAYRAARGIHARTQKLNLIWKHVARRAHGRETFDWGFYDPVIAAAIAHGLRAQVTVTGPAPPWATGDGRPGVYRPDPRAFGRFAAAAARHYAGRVHRWSIWNEPNWPSWLAPPSAAAGIYRRLYRAGWRAIRGVDPHAVVLFGELAPMGPPEAAIPPLRFLRGVTCRDRGFRPTHRCAPLRTNGFAHHPYSLRWPPDYRGPTPDDVTIGSLGRLRYVLRRLAHVHALTTPHGRTPDLYLTEFGWHAHSRTIREPERSRYAVRSFEMALREPHVRQLLWYQLVAPPRIEGRRPWDTALLDSNGHSRRVFKALRRWTRRAARADRLR